MGTVIAAMHHGCRITTLGALSFTLVRVDLHHERRQCDEGPGRGTSALRGALPVATTAGAELTMVLP